MGAPTGLDFERLMVLRARSAQWLDGEPLHGAIWRAGLPKSLPQSAAASAMAGRLSSFAELRDNPVPP
jgi:hydroxymethylglutaryl-CoA lyase